MTYFDKTFFHRFSAAIIKRIMKNKQKVTDSGTKSVLFNTYTPVSTMQSPVH